MQFTFGDKREVYLVDESVLPVTEKERRGEGKSSNSPRMKCGHGILVLTNNCFLTGCDNSAQSLLQTDALSRLLIFK